VQCIYQHFYLVSSRLGCNFVNRISEFQISLLNLGLKCTFGAFLLCFAFVVELEFIVLLMNGKVDEPILAGRLKWRPTFEPKMVMKETENCLLHNLESQLWAIGFSSIWVAY
jgi:hypothetical protein